MRLGEMKTNCRKCGRELRAESKDTEFATFFCMKCGIYTTRPIEEFQEEKKEESAPAQESQ